MPSSFPWPLYYFPPVRVAGRFPFSPHVPQEFYRHPTLALHQHFYRGSVWIGKKRYALQPGDITLTPPDTVSRYELEEASYHWCIHFPPPATSGGDLCTRLPLYLHLGSRADVISERFRAIAEIAARGSSGSRQKQERARAEAAAMLQALLLKLPSLTLASPKRHYSRKSDQAIEAIGQKIDLNFHQPLRVEDLARESGLSRNYFAVRFHAIFGVTAPAYLLARRIELARNLLLSSDLPVKQVAYECGIHDPHYFNKQFRRSTGVSPTEYRLRAGNVW